MRNVRRSSAKNNRINGETKFHQKIVATFRKQPKILHEIYRKVNKCRYSLKTSHIFWPSLAKEQRCINEQIKLFFINLFFRS